MDSLSWEDHETSTAPVVVPTCTTTPAPTVAHDVMVVDLLLLVIHDHLHAELGERDVESVLVLGGLHFEKKGVLVTVMLQHLVVHFSDDTAITGRGGS